MTRTAPRRGDGPPIREEPPRLTASPNQAPLARPLPGTRGLNARSSTPAGGRGPRPAGGRGAGTRQGPVHRPQAAPHRPAEEAARTASLWGRSGPRPGGQPGSGSCQRAGKPAVAERACAGEHSTCPAGGDRGRRSQAGSPAHAGFPVCSGGWGTGGGGHRLPAASQPPLGTQWCLQDPDRAAHRSRWAAARQGPGPLLRPPRPASLSGPGSESRFPASGLSTRPLPLSRQS